jgi:4-hydroxybutyryl-CoA dehydratase/vinylacetyl-CoA-Delta-isomerase
MIRVVEQYLRSLRDGRELYHEGKRVDDVTTHPAFKPVLQPASLLYVLAQDPRWKELLTSTLPDGEPISVIYEAAKEPEDLLRRRRIVIETGRICYGFPAGIRWVGRDVLDAVAIVARRMDRALGTKYAKKVETYREYLVRNDLDVVGAMTDVKGDRSLRPSDQKPHKDFYVRIVDERKDGIVVRGAKFHISCAPVANEIFVCPTRTMRKEDKDYAVSFAVPVNTPGVRLITASKEPITDVPDEYPVSSQIWSAEALIIFDDVFVPMERVFMKGEWQFSGAIAHMFANFHRLFADSYKYSELEVLVGTAALLAEYNGIEKYEHVRDKLSWLAMYLETVGALGELACKNCVYDAETGLAYPNPVYSNACKFFFAENYHQAVKLVQDLGGGLVADVPSFKNFLNPETKPYIEKYFQGRADVPTEHRLRAIMLARDLCSQFLQATTIHAEGSLAAQKIAIHATADWERYKAIARRVAKIPGPEHPVTKDLPVYPPELQKA